LQPIVGSTTVGMLSHRFSHTFGKGERPGPECENLRAVR
jgi:hypothetical protein